MATLVCDRSIVEEEGEREKKLKNEKRHAHTLSGDVLSKPYDTGGSFE
jgi:hypothetical protein